MNYIKLLLIVLCIIIFCLATTTKSYGKQLLLDEIAFEWDSEEYDTEIDEEALCPDDTYLEYDEDSDLCFCIDGYETIFEDDGTIICLKHEIAMEDDYEIANNEEAVTETVPGIINAKLSGSSACSLHNNQTQSDFRSTWIFILAIPIFILLLLRKNQITKGGVMYHKKNIYYKVLSIVFILLCCHLVACDGGEKGLTPSDDIITNSDTPVSDPPINIPGADIAIEVVTINPTQTCGVESKVCNSEELIKRVHDNSDLVAVLRLGDFINTTIVQSYIDSSEDNKKMFDDVASSLNSVFQHVQTDYTNIESIVLAARINEETPDDKDSYLIISLKYDLTTEAIEAFKNELLLGDTLITSDLFIEDEDRKNLNLSFISSDDGLQFEAALQDLEGNKHSSMDCLIENKFITCAESEIKDEIFFMPESLSLYGKAEGEIIYGCEVFKALIDTETLAELTSKEEGDDNLEGTSETAEAEGNVEDKEGGIDLTSIGLGDGVVGISLDFYEAVLYNDKVYFDALNLSLSFYQENDWKARFTIELADSVVNSVVNSLIEEKLTEEEATVE